MELRSGVGDARMDVDAVLQSVQERDKWRHRLELLQASLADVRSKKLKVQHRLRRLRGELRKLNAFSDAILDHAPIPADATRSHATSNPRLPAR
jgi:hypothetical protein